MYTISEQQQKQLDLLFTIIDLAEQDKIRIYITGGYGLDALYGELTRDHRDIDIYLHASDENVFINILYNLGFTATNQLVGEIKKREYKNKNYTDDFSIECGIIEVGMKLMNATSIDDYIPSEPIGKLENKPIWTFTLKAFKKMHEFNNSPAAKHTERYRHQEWLDDLMPKLEAKYGK